MTHISLKTTNVNLVFRGRRKSQGITDVIIVRWASWVSVQPILYLLRYFKVMFSIGLVLQSDLLTVLLDIRCCCTLKESANFD